jgi:two-component system chemotaxis response regulator CheY
MSRHYVRQILESIGIQEIAEAANGADALEQLAKRDFDLIISDYNMPEINGRELVEHIRADSNQTGIPVLMITSEQNEANLAAIENAGVSALCNKPLAFEGLRGLIQRLIAENS